MSEISLHAASDQLWDLRNIRLLMDEPDIPAREGDYIAICHPSAIYGKNWRARLRRERRLRRRARLLDCRVSARCYQDGAKFYRDRVRGWLDDEKLSFTREWLDRLRATTMHNALTDMVMWRLVTKHWRKKDPTVKLAEPPKKYGKGRRKR